MAVIEVEGLKKSYGETSVLKELNFEVYENNITGLIGPNGAGKSTTVQILTGQLSRDSGNVQVLGLDPWKDPVELRKKLGVLPEREDPPSFLTGNEYLEYISDVRDDDINKQKWIERFNLEGKMDKPTKEISKGERQKLMIIQAFFHEPELVFIDEPLINLDPFVQEEAKKLFKEYAENTGSIFLCTHLLDLAEELCDNVLFLDDGEIKEDIDEVENLKNHLFDTQ
jgi:ABC-2 type transport system ATP-binding protein